jgi:hypothetical protein
VAFSCFEPQTHQRNCLGLAHWMAGPMASTAAIGRPLRARRYQPAQSSGGWEALHGPSHGSRPSRPSMITAQDYCSGCGGLAHCSARAAGSGSPSHGKCTRTRYIALWRYIAGLWRINVGTST